MYITTTFPQFDSWFSAYPECHIDCCIDSKGFDDKHDGQWAEDPARSPWIFR